MPSFTVPEGARRSRADKALAAAFPEHSRSSIQRAFAAGLVLRAGRPIGQSDPVRAGEALEFELPAVRPSELRPVARDLSVLFEDRHLIAIDKPAGVVVHPGAGTGEDTLVHALLAHCRGGLSGVGGVERPGIVHRLDRETSGVILAAKTDAAHRGLAEQFARRTVTKEYLALVAASPKLLSGTIEKPIGRNPKVRHRMAVVPVGRGGRPARTDWAIVERFGPFASLVRCQLHTGRTHQIRVHMKAIGHVLLGDRVYGWKPDNRLPKEPPRVMLHAEHLRILHPATGRELDLRAPVPGDFAEMMAVLRG
jgi:23S rRNA pseudouridine1911/1915/1917 synthase